MAYRVKLTRRDLRDLDHLYGYIGAANSVPAQHWFSGLEERIGSLALTPHGGAFTHEDPGVRQLIDGNRPHLYRILFRTSDEAEEVRVLSVWHGKRQYPRSPLK